MNSGLSIHSNLISLYISKCIDTVGSWRFQLSRLAVKSQTCRLQAVFFQLIAPHGHHVVVLCRQLEVLNPGVVHGSHQRLRKETHLLLVIFRKWSSVSLSFIFSHPLLRFHQLFNQPSIWTTWSSPFPVVKSSPVLLAGVTKPEASLVQRLTVFCSKKLRRKTPTLGSIRGKEDLTSKKQNHPRNGRKDPKCPCP